MEGIITEPIAATVAAFDPDRAAKKAEDNIEIPPKPPRKCPTKAPANLTSLFETPPQVINSPASIKKGMANKGKESLLVYIL
jgi:hypothetical protein